jgi:hypothetical protein
VHAVRIAIIHAKLERFVHAPTDLVCISLLRTDDDDLPLDVFQDLEGVRVSYVRWEGRDENVVSANALVGHLALGSRPRASFARTLKSEFFADVHWRIFALLNVGHIGDLDLLPSLNFLERMEFCGGPP